MGINDQRKPEGLNTSGVGGVQMADVSVDTETGIVKMKKFVAVQDFGLVINPKLAESQIHGAVIMGICGALLEERVMDQQTGRMLNADMEFYKLAGIGDIGEIVAHLDVDPANDKRGVVGLGEPPRGRRGRGDRQCGGQCHRRARAERAVTPDRVLRPEQHWNGRKA